MGPNSIALLVIFFSSIFGAFGGFVAFKIHNKKINEQILKNAKEVIEGKRKNSIFIDGEEFEARKFIFKNKDVKEDIIDFDNLKQYYGSEEHIEDICKEHIETIKPKKKKVKKKSVKKVKKVSKKK